MPNIIEQQDILKGLPDARLAMLLQNPVADIPPFLVAAEAQRRQAIRQQFAGQAPKESVVESLTKQLANVPQNIQAPAQIPPMVPPTPPMAGVAALEQQQAMQQAAMNAQQMRGGGMVQRYQVGGQVKPWWEIPDLSDTFSGITGYLGEKIGDLAEFATTPYSERREREEGSEAIPPLDVMTPEELADFNASVAVPDVPVGGARSVPPKPRLRPDDLAKPAPGETEDEFRARYEELLRANEPSDWEKSQRWFAMAEQFLDPSKTTMQSVAGAGRAFADQSAAMNAAQRQAEREYMKGMLEYDMAVSERDRAERAAQSTGRLESMKYQGEQAMREAEFYRKAADDAKGELSDYMKNSMVPPEADDPRVVELRERIKINNEAASTALRRAQYYQYQYGKSYGTYGVPEMWDGGDTIIR